MDKPPRRRYTRELSVRPHSATRISIGAVTLVSAYWLCTACNAQPALATVTDFLGSVCINTHTGTWDASYGSPNGHGSRTFAAAKVLDELRYTGLDCIRDTVEFGWELPDFQALAAAGIRFNFFIGASPGADSLNDQVARIATLAPAVLSVEGPNETDNWPVRYGGKIGLKATRAMQAALFHLVHATPRLAGIPVIEASLGKEASYPTMAGTGHADYANAHAYYFSWMAGRAEPILAQIPSRVTQAQSVAPGKPVVATESGWETPYNPAIWGSVDGLTQAKLILDDLLDHYIAGISRTYLYQLMDESALGEPPDTFGLFLQDGQPKPSAMALHHLSALLRATGPDGAIAVPVHLKALPAGGHVLQLARGDGSTAVILWTDRPVWSEGAPLVSSGVCAELDVPAGVSVQAADPLYDNAAAPVRDGRVEIPDHPVVVLVGRQPK